VAHHVPHDLHGDDWALYQTFLSLPLYTMARFGMWEAILEEPKPREDARYWTGIWHYARGLARVHRSELEAAATELEAIDAIAGDPAAMETLVGLTNARSLLQIARGVLSAELLAKRGDYHDAIAELDRAVRLEDSLIYNEPPDWYYPVRHTLGAVLLEAGRADEAETVFWQDLRERNRENGYALKGLAQSLAAQGRDDEAAAIEKRFRTAWADADVELHSPRF
jgi:tetratricopeptide (TPR) repeat protein